MAGCSHVYSTHDPGAVLELTIDRTDTVGDATAVLITFTTVDGSTTEGYGLDSRGLPATLDIERLGRTGPVTLSVVAIDPTEVVVGRGSTGTGFGVAIRWLSRTFGDGKIELYQLTPSGVPQNVTTITSTSGSSGTSYGALGVAERSDGTVMVVWHSCKPACSVYGRLVRADGALASDEFVVPTTVAGGQHDPSVTAVGDVFAIAWTDDGRTAPDSQGSAVRARILHPAP